jgi:YVTN family beta-propeller protein
MRACILGLWLAGRAWAAAGGTIAIAPATGELFVAESDNDTVAVVAPDGSRVLRRVAVGGGPEQVVVDDAGRAYVTLRTSGEVARIEPGALEAGTRAAVGRDPFGIALAHDKVYVSLAGEAAVSELDAADLSPRRRVAVAPNPRGLALSNDGAHLYVAHLTAPEVSDVPLWSSREPVRRRALRGISDERRPNLTFALAISRDGKSLYVPHVEADVGAEVPAATRSSGYGGGVSQPLMSAVGSMQLGSDAQPVIVPDTPMSQPRAIAVDPVNGDVFVAALGSDSVIVLRPSGGRLDDAEKTFHFDGGSGLTGVAVSSDGKRLFAYASFKHELLTRDLKARTATAHLVLGPDPLGPEAAHGRRLFHEANSRVSAEGVLACASCHPEGRKDGLVWRQAEGPRKTPILAGRLEGTAPYSWLGEHATLKDHIRHTIKTRLRGKGLDDRELADLERYLTGLPSPPQAGAPAEHIARGRELFGSDDLGCAHCHKPDRHFSDGIVHDIGTISEDEAAALAKTSVGKVRDAQLTRQEKESAELETLKQRLAEINTQISLDSWDKMLLLAGGSSVNLRKWKADRARVQGRIRFLEVDSPREQREQLRQAAAAAKAEQRQKYDTPTLTRVADNGPWLHDGRAKTLRELFALHNADDRMGRTSQLSPDDLDALVAYLETL